MNAPAKKIKLKLCANPDCGKDFVPYLSTQKTCSVQCAMVHGRLKEQERMKRRNRKAKQDYYRDHKPHQEALTQREFNRMVVLIDQGRPCISCGRMKCGVTWDCGHYKSVGSTPELRFDPRNAYKQGSACNRGQAKYSANERTVKTGYEANLRERYGQEMIDYCSRHHPLPNYTCEDLRELRAKFAAEIRYIKRHGAPSREWRALPKGEAE